MKLPIIFKNPTKNENPTIKHKLWGRICKKVNRRYRIVAYKSINENSKKIHYDVEGLFIRFYYSIKQDVTLEEAIDTVNWFRDLEFHSIYDAYKEKLRKKLKKKQILTF